MPIKNNYEENARIFLERISHHVTGNRLQKEELGYKSVFSDR